MNNLKCEDPSEIVEFTPQEAPEPTQRIEPALEPSVAELDDLDIVDLRHNEKKSTSFSYVGSFTFCFFRFRRYIQQARCVGSRAGCLKNRKC